VLFFFEFDNLFEFSNQNKHNNLKIVNMKKKYSLLNYKVLIIFLFLSSSSMFAGNVRVISLDGGESFGVNEGNNALDVSTEWTFEAWINVGSKVTSNYECIMDRRTVMSFYLIDDNEGYAVRYVARDGNGNIIASLRCDGGGSTTEHANMIEGDWYHVAATFDGTTARLYVGDTLYDESTDSDWNLTASSNSLNIGGRYWGSYSRQMSNTDIDEVRMSNVARDITDMNTQRSAEAYSVDLNTIILMHLDNSANIPTYETGLLSPPGGPFDSNISAADYVNPTDQLLRPNYQSQTTGNWSDSLSWQYFDGSTGVYEDATLIPDYYDNEIAILNSHTITADDDISIDQTTIILGGTLNIVDTVTVSLKSGAGIDMDVSGILIKSGSLTRSSGATIEIQDGGKYQHNTAANVSTATWNIGSTCEIIGVGTATTFLEFGNVGQNFHNFTWNAASQLRNVGLQGLTTVNGNLVIQNSNGNDVRLVTSATDKFLTITGNTTISGGILELTNGSGDCYLICYGDFTQTGGELSAPGTGTGFLRFGPLSGNYSGTFTHSSGTFTPEDIQINGGYFLTLASDMNTGAAPMTIVGDLTVPFGSTLTIGTSLLVSSTATNQGSLINNGTVTGDVDVECYTTAGQWHGMSAPLDDQIANTFFLNYNPVVWMKSYNEDDKTYDWVTDLDTDLDDMTGWMIFIDESTDQTYNFNGAVRTGTIGSANNLIRTSDTTGYNFVGNPFTSAIDWDASTGWTKSTNLEDATYVYNNGNWDTYINGAGTNDGSRYIAMNQGFFVQVSDGGTYPENGTLQMTSAVCVHDDVSFKNTNSEQQIIRLQLTDNELTDETVIRITNEATQGWDGNLDAHKLFSFNDDYPQIYSTENGFMSINSLPESVETIPLDVVGTNGNQMTISATEFGDFTELLLFDEYLDEFTDLTKEDYNFIYSNSITSRFFLSFLTTDIDEELNLSQRSFYAYSSNREIKVVLENSDFATISIYNLLGQEIITKTIHSTEASFDVDKTGYYIVKVSDGKYTETQKVIIK